MKSDFVSVITLIKFSIKFDWMFTLTETGSDRLKLFSLRMSSELSFSHTGEMPSDPENVM